MKKSSVHFFNKENLPIVELGEVVNFIGGSQPAKSNFIYEEKQGYIRLLQIRDYKSDKNLTYIPEKSTKKFCLKHDVMIGRYGPPVFQILRGLEGAYNVALMKAEPTEKINSDYLYYFLKQKKLFRLIDGLSQRTAGQSGVDMKALKTYPMLLPSLVEQQKIAEILDAADVLRQKDQQLIDHYSALSQSLFLDMFGDPVKNQKKWVICSLADHGEFKNGLNYRKGEKGIKVKYLGVGDFKSYSRIDDTNSLHSIDLDNIPSDNYFLNDGDIVFVRSNGNGKLVGRSIAVFSKGVKVTFSGFCIRYRIEDEFLNPIYLTHLFREKSFREVLLQSGRGANIQNINQKLLSALKIPSPPITLQNKFSQHIDAIEKQKQQAQASLEQSNNLFNSLLQKAFTGELTNKLTSERSH